MKFIADENIDKAIIDNLRKKGHSVLYIAEVSPGFSDQQVLQTANKEKALLLTADRDFIELFFLQEKIPNGAILIRLAGLSSKNKAELVARAIQEHAKELPHNFTVITESNIRIRKKT